MDVVIMKSRFELTERFPDTRYQNSIIRHETFEFVRVVYHVITEQVECIRLPLPVVAILDRVRPAEVDLVFDRKHAREVVGISKAAKHRGQCRARTLHHLDVSQVLCRLAFLGKYPVGMVTVVDGDEEWLVAGYGGYGVVLQVQKGED